MSVRAGFRSAGQKQQFPFLLNNNLTLQGTVGFEANAKLELHFRPADGRSDFKQTPLLHLLLRKVVPSCCLICGNDIQSYRSLSCVTTYTIILILNSAIADFSHFFHII